MKRDALARELADDALVEMDEKRDCAHAKRALAMSSEAWGYATRGDRALAFDTERRSRLPKARRALLDHVERIGQETWRAIDGRCGCRALDPQLNGVRRR